MPVTSRVATKAIPLLRSYLSIFHPNTNHRKEVREIIQELQNGRIGCWLELFERLDVIARKKSGLFNKISDQIREVAEFDSRLFIHHLRLQWHSDVSLRKMGEYFERFSSDADIAVDVTVGNDPQLLSNLFKYVTTHKKEKLQVVLFHSYRFIGIKDNNFQPFEDYLQVIQKYAPDYMSQVIEGILFNILYDKPYSNEKKASCFLYLLQKHFDFIGADLLPELVQKQNLKGETIVSIFVKTATPEMLESFFQLFLNKTNESQSDFEFFANRNNKKDSPLTILEMIAEQRSADELIGLLEMCNEDVPNFLCQVIRLESKNKRDNIFYSAALAKDSSSFIKLLNLTIDLDPNIVQVLEQVIGKSFLYLAMSQPMSVVVEALKMVMALKPHLFKEALNIDSGFSVIFEVAKNSFDVLMVLLELIEEHHPTLLPIVLKARDDRYCSLFDYTVARHSVDQVFTLLSMQMKHLTPKRLLSLLDTAYSCEKLCIKMVCNREASAQFVKLLDEPRANFLRDHLLATPESCGRLAKYYPKESHSFFLQCIEDRDENKLNILFSRGFEFDFSWFIRAFNARFAEKEISRELRSIYKKQLSSMFKDQKIDVLTLSKLYEHLGIFDACFDVEPVKEDIRKDIYGCCYLIFKRLGIADEFQDYRKNEFSFFFNGEREAGMMKRLSAVLNPEHDLYTVLYSYAVHHADVREALLHLYSWQTFPPQAQKQCSHLLEKTQFCTRLEQAMAETIIKQRRAIPSLQSSAVQSDEHDVADTLRDELQLTL